MHRDIISLNVGGTKFQTTRETLTASSSYFSALLSGSFAVEHDENGNIFLDRSPEIFSVILQGMRTNQRPPQRVVAAMRQQILEMCNYFGADHLADKISGHTCAADLAPDCRQIQCDEACGAAQLLDVFATDLVRKPAEALQLPLLFHEPAGQMDRANVLAGDVGECTRRLDGYSKGLLGELRDTPSVAASLVVAGGAVTSSLTGCSVGARDLSSLYSVRRLALWGAGGGLEERDAPRTGDLDLFLIADPDNCMAILDKVFDAILLISKKHQGDAARVLVTRSRFAVSFFTAASPTPIQVVLAAYADIESLLGAFDVDCCAAAFRLDTGRFVFTPRCKRALEHRVNVVDSMRHSTSYIARLEKYARRCRFTRRFYSRLLNICALWHLCTCFFFGGGCVRRGFSVALPGFDEALVSTSLTSASYVLLKRWDLLLKLSPATHAGATFVDVPAGAKTLHVQVSKEQRASAVRGLQRMFVLSNKRNIKHVDQPHLASSGGGTVIAQNLEHGCALVSAGVRGEYILLWGLACSDESDESEAEEEDSENCSMSPVAQAVHEPAEDDAWWRSGGMPRIARSMNTKGALAAKSTAESRVYAQLEPNSFCLRTGPKI